MIGMHNEISMLSYSFQQMTISYITMGYGNIYKKFGCNDKLRKQLQSFLNQQWQTLCYHSNSRRLGYHGMAMVLIGYVTIATISKLKVTIATNLDVSNATATSS